MLQPQHRHADRVQDWRRGRDRAHRPLGAVQHAARHRTAAAAGRPPACAVAALFGINEGTVHTWRCRAWWPPATSTADRRPLPPRRPPARAPGPPAGEPLAPTTRRWERRVAHGGGDRRPAHRDDPRADLRRCAGGPPGRAARRRVAAPRQPRRCRSPPTIVGHVRSLHGRARRRRPPRSRPALWDLEHGRAGRAAPRRLDGPALPTSPPGDSEVLARRVRRCRPPCCATSRPIRCCPAELLARAGRAAALRSEYDDWDAAYRQV